MHGFQGTGADNVHNELFVGQCQNFIEATAPGVDHHTSEQEQFVDLSLDIEGCKNVFESLVAFCREEKLDGPNQICIEGQTFAVCGSQSCLLYPLVCFHV